MEGRALSTHGKAPGSALALERLRAFRVRVQECLVDADQKIENLSNAASLAYLAAELKAG